MIDIADGYRLHVDDCGKVMAAMPEASIDAIVCDPPYLLEFMGAEWDSLRSRSGTKWSGEPESPIVDGGPTPYDRARVAQPPVRPLCRRCGRGGSGAWGRCECDVPLIAPPSFGTEMQEWHYRWAVEAFRVLKPGGYLVAFGGTRTYHRLACAVEDAGFEIRDSIRHFYPRLSQGTGILVGGGDATEADMGLAWVYCSGFP